jgi:predicted RNA binding protein YcfA (HicA-like mRNA interferase family)
VSKYAKLVEKITNVAGTNNVTFDELCECAKQLGWKQKPKRGTSHVIFWHDKCPGILNFQPGKNGKAKPYQVKQLRNYINSLKMFNQLPLGPLE